MTLLAEDAEPAPTTPATKPFPIETVAASAGAAAFGALFTNLAPTGTPWWDPLLVIATAVLVVVAAAHSSQRVLLGAAVVATAFAGLSFWWIVGFGGFVAALASKSLDDRRVELHAISGALTLLTLLHLRPGMFFGSATLIAGAVMLTILVSGYGVASAKVKRGIRRTVLAIGLTMVAVLVVAGFMAVSIRSAANAGIDAARSGLDSARAGQTQELNLELERARSELKRANDLIGSPVLAPLAMLPVAAQNHRSLVTATERGLLVADEAVAAANEGNLAELELRQGQIDLGLLSSMAPRLTSTVQSLEATVRAIERDRSGWLVGPIDDQLQSLVAEATEVLPDARLSAHAARVMPDMLGRAGERRYLMLFGSPGESREFGGFVGGYALIGIDNGTLDLVEAGGLNDLILRAEQGVLDDPLGYPTEFKEADPATFPQNLTSTPNIEVIARAVRDIYPELAGAPVDGVIYADPFALGAMMDLTGPITIEGRDEPLDRSGVVDFIFDEQYRDFATRDARFNTMGSLASATAQALQSVDLPGPERLGEVLGPLARAGRLQVVTFDDDENDFLASVRLQRNFVAPAGVDSVAVLQANATASKLDIYLHRDIHYDVTVAPDGTLTAVVDMELRSEVPDDFAPLTFGETDGTNQVLLSLYSRHDLVDVTVNGDAHEFVTQQEFGFSRYALFKVPIAPNEVASIRFRLVGQAPEGDYRLAAWSQPLVNNDSMTITFRGPGAEPVSATREITENWLFSPS